MPTQGERQNYNWRPNDNSSTTLLRYDLEAEHWTRAFQNAAAKNKPIDYAGTFNTIGLVISLILNLIYIILYGIVSFFSWAFRSIEFKPKVTKNKTPLKLDPQKEIRRQKVQKVLAKRPKISHSKRDDLFKKAALMVVLKQKVSISNLMFELKIDFNKISQLIDELYEAGIISNIYDKKRRHVLIEDKESLDLFYELEKSFSI